MKAVVWGGDEKLSDLRVEQLAQRPNRHEMLKGITTRSPGAT